MEQPIPIDNQPISATFFKEGKWLTDFITPNTLEVQELYRDLTEDIDELEDIIIACWEWVASRVKYTKFVQGKLWVGGKASTQSDFWASPSITKQVRVGNCATKSFLLTSLLRNALPAEKVFCVLGNLYNGKPGGHAWVQARLNGSEYIIESTRPDVSPLVLIGNTERYEAIHLFNDEVTYMIAGRTVMEPFTACYSTWLKDYLDWAYIEGGER